MPAFIMPIETTKAIMSFRALDTFAQGYVEAMFFTDTGTGDDDELEHVTFDDLSPGKLLVHRMAAGRACSEQHLRGTSVAPDKGANHRPA